MKETNIKLELGAKTFQGAYTVLENEVPVCYTWDEKSAERVRRGLELVQDEELNEEYYKGIQQHNERVAAKLKALPGVECHVDPNFTEKDVVESILKSKQINDLYGH